MKEHIRTLETESAYPREHLIDHAALRRWWTWLVPSRCWGPVDAWGIVISWEVPHAG